MCHRDGAPKLGSGTGVAEVDLREGDERGEERRPHVRHGLGGRLRQREPGVAPGSRVGAQPERDGLDPASPGWRRGEGAGRSRAEGERGRDRVQVLHEIVGGRCVRCGEEPGRADLVVESIAREEASHRPFGQAGHLRPGTKHPGGQGDIRMRGGCELPEGGGEGIPLQLRRASSRATREGVAERGRELGEDREDASGGDAPTENEGGVGSGRRDGRLSCDLPRRDLRLCQRRRDPRGTPVDRRRG